MEVFTNDINSISINSNENCQELAERGERAIRSNDTQRGIQLLEKALLIGSDDELLLSAVYSQLGNAYFALRNYSRARLYYMSDLKASKALNDEAQQAKAHSNLSATYTMLQEFENAIICADTVIKIGQKLNDEKIECRGLYNLGLAHLNYGISKMKSNNSKENVDFDNEGEELKRKEHLAKALAEFERSLNIAERLNDRILCGLTLGNIANTYFYDMEYRKAIEYHEKRMLIAEELGDKTSILRTLCNIATARVLLGEFYEGRENYSAASEMAKEMNSPTKIAQLNKELANINALIENHEKLGQLKIDDDDELFRQSDLELEAINNDFFDMIVQMQAKRIEDQRAEFPLSIQTDNQNFANLPNSSGRSRIGTLKENTMKGLSNMKLAMTSSSNKIRNGLKHKELKTEFPVQDNVETPSIHSETSENNNTNIDAKNSRRITK